MKNTFEYTWTCNRFNIFRTKESLNIANSKTIAHKYTSIKFTLIYTQMPMHYAFET